MCAFVMLHYVMSFNPYTLSDDPSCNKHAVLQLTLLHCVS